MPGAATTDWNDVRTRRQGALPAGIFKFSNGVTLSGGVSVSTNRFRARRPKRQVGSLCYPKFTGSMSTASVTSSGKRERPDDFCQRLAQFAHRARPQHDLVAVKSFRAQQRRRRRAGNDQIFEVGYGAASLRRAVFGLSARLARTARPTGCKIVFSNSRFKCSAENFTFSSLRPLSVSSATRLTGGYFNCSRNSISCS